jgi:hypothetical protein
VASVSSSNLVHVHLSELVAHLVDAGLAIAGLLSSRLLEAGLRLLLSLLSLHSRREELAGLLEASLLLLLHRRLGLVELGCSGLEAGLLLLGGSSIHLLHVGDGVLSPLRVVVGRGAASGGRGSRGRMSSRERRVGRNLPLALTGRLVCIVSARVPMKLIATILSAYSLT